MSINSEEVHVETASNTCDIGRTWDSRQAQDVARPRPETVVLGQNSEMLASRTEIGGKAHRAELHYAVRRLDFEPDDHKACAA